MTTKNTVNMKEHIERLDTLHRYLKELKELRTLAYYIVNESKSFYFQIKEFTRKVDKTGLYEKSYIGRTVSTCIRFSEVSSIQEENIVIELLMYRHTNDLLKMCFELIRDDKMLESHKKSKLINELMLFENNFTHQLKLKGVSMDSVVQQTNYCIEKMLQGYMQSYLDAKEEAISFFNGGFILKNNVRNVNNYNFYRSVVAVHIDCYTAFYKLATRVPLKLGVAIVFNLYDSLYNWENIYDKNKIKKDVEIETKSVNSSNLSKNKEYVNLKGKSVFNEKRVVEKMQEIVNLINYGDITEKDLYSLKLLLSEGVYNDIKELELQNQKGYKYEQN